MVTVPFGSHAERVSVAAHGSWLVPDGLDIRETTPQGILIPNDVLMLRHDTLHDTLARSPDLSEVHVCVQAVPRSALQSDQLPRTADLVAWLSAPLGAAIKPPWQFDTIMRLQSGAELS